MTTMINFTTYYIHNVSFNRLLMPTYELNRTKETAKYTNIYNNYFLISYPIKVDKKMTNMASLFYYVVYAEIQSNFQLINHKVPHPLCQLTSSSITK